MSGGRKPHCVNVFLAFSNPRHPKTLYFNDFHALFPKKSPKSIFFKQLHRNVASVSESHRMVSEKRRGIEGFAAWGADVISRTNSECARSDQIRQSGCQVATEAVFVQDHIASNRVVEFPELYPARICVQDVSGSGLQICAYWTQLLIDVQTCTHT